MAPDKTETDSSDCGLSEIVEEKLEQYFAMHEDGKVPEGLYSRVLREMETVLLKVTMRHVGSNQMKAAKVLGINRNTLRKKLIDLRLDV